MVLAFAEVEDSVREFGAVGESHGVGAAQRHHLLHAEPLRGEDVDDLRQRHVGACDVPFHVAHARLEPVFPPEEDGVEGPADHGHEVPGGLGEDVGAGDDAGAVELEPGLGADHDVEGVAGEGVVDVVVALGGVRLGGGDEKGSVAAVDDAVVEEEAEGAGGGGGDGELLVGDDFLDGFGEVGAGFGVVVEAQIWFFGGRKKREEEEERDEEGGRGHCHVAEMEIEMAAAAVVVVDEKREKGAKWWLFLRVAWEENNGSEGFKYDYWPSHFLSLSPLFS